VARIRSRGLGQGPFQHAELETILEQHAPYAALKQGSNQPVRGFDARWFGGGDTERQIRVQKEIQGRRCRSGAQVQNDVISVELTQSPSPAGLSPRAEGHRAAGGVQLRQEREPRDRGGHRDQLLVR
jgi:hypothetical protein